MKKLQDYLEQIKKIEKCFSKDNLWIKTFSEMIVPEEITRKHVKAWIERIECVRYEEVEVQFKYQDWKERYHRNGLRGILKMARKSRRAKCCSGEKKKNYRFSHQ